MANVNAPRGFRPVRYSDGKPYMGAVNKYYKSASVILGVGDPVVRTTGSTDPQAIGASVTRATVGSYVTGHIVAFDAIPASLSQVGYMLAADTGYVYVADELDMVLEVQEGGSGTALTAANIGQSINAITAVNANTTIGTSLFQIDNATVTTASTGTYVIVGLVQRADNVLGQYAKWLVKVNLSTEDGSGASSVLAI